MYIDVYSDERVDIAPSSSRTFRIRFAESFSRPMEDVELFLKLFNGVEFPSKIIAEITENTLTLTNRGNQVVSVFTDVPVAAIRLPEKIANFEVKAFEIVPELKIENTLLGYTNVDILSVSKRVQDLLIDAGYPTIRSLYKVSAVTLEAIKGIGKTTAERIINDVLSYNE